MTGQTFREAPRSWLKQPRKVAGAVQDPHDANLLGQLPKEDQVAAVHNDPQPRRDIRGRLREGAICHVKAGLARLIALRER